MKAFEVKLCSGKQMRLDEDGLNKLRLDLDGKSDSIWSVIEIGRRSTDAQPEY